MYSNDVYALWHAYVYVHMYVFVVQGIKFTAYYYLTLEIT